MSGDRPPPPARFGDAGHGFNPGPEESLFGSGLLDSFSLPDFVSGLGAGVQHLRADSDLSARKFDTIEKVETYLDAKM